LNLFRSCERGNNTAQAAAFSTVLTFMCTLLDIKMVLGSFFEATTFDVQQSQQSKFDRERFDQRLGLKATV
jgi:hypothetical protein